MRHGILAWCMYSGEGKKGRTMGRDSPMNWCEKKLNRLCSTVYQIYWKQDFSVFF